MRTLASVRRYLFDHVVSLRHPDILEALIAWCLTSVVRTFELVFCTPRMNINVKIVWIFSSSETGAISDYKVRVSRSRGLAV